jgi:hypothetical protein
MFQRRELIFVLPVKASEHRISERNFISSDSRVSMNTTRMILRFSDSTDKYQTR